MTRIINTSSELTMSSREIAAATGKKHEYVMRDITVMLAKMYGASGHLKFEGSYRHKRNGQLHRCFDLPIREILILVSRYSVVPRHRVVNRWIELEQAQSSV